ncbi:hypothetical protein C8J57DRAFT_1228241 [Mycena rebaudengoi]|nr:hypothetical protein C8J57DRAFT_1228241 [Mycena rebaudengoi]
MDMNGAQHRIKFTTQDPYSALDPEGTVVDSIHVQPAKTLKNGEELPPRFDTALVNDGSGKIMAGSISRGTNSSCLLTSSPPQIVDFLVSDNASVVEYELKASIKTEGYSPDIRYAVSNNHLANSQSKILQKLVFGHFTSAMFLQDAPCEFRWPLGKQFCRTVPIKKMLHKWAEDNTLNELAAHTFFAAQLGDVRSQTVAVCHPFKTDSGDDSIGLELRLFRRRYWPNNEETQFVFRKLVLNVVEHHSIIPSPTRSGKK